MSWDTGSKGALGCISTNKPEETKKAKTKGKGEGHKSESVGPTSGRKYLEGPCKELLSLMKSPGVVLWLLQAPFQ